MKILIRGAEEAGIQDEMIKNCKTLIERRINKIPEAGEEIEILYSEKDPLMKEEEIDDEAYMIYFTVTEIEPLNESDLEKLTITAEINF